jgi:DNA polymerase-3 subunit gamma/tau
VYKVLYRKYRPQCFADVVGQPQVTVTLKNELMRGRVSHAYLFTGSRGTGKTTCAKILAKAVNCLNPQDGDPCGECEICRGLDEGTVLDVVEIDAASNNGVDNIRQLIEECSFTPASAKYRVYIIDEVHMLSTSAFNALLKTLEEPPAHVIFILATTEVHKLLPTILSRCQRFDFRRIPPEEIALRLEEVAEKEEASLDHDAALLIARIADGAMRDALSLLDQCLGRDAHVTLQVVNRTAGVAAREYLSSLAQAVTGRNCGAALEIIDELHRASKDLNRLCEETAEYFRGLMLIKTMRDPSDLLPVSAEEMETMTSQAMSMSLSDILHSLDTLEDALQKMRFGNPRAQLEMAFVRLCSPELDSTKEALLRRIEALERGMPAGGVTLPAPAPVPVVEKPAEKPEEPVTVPERIPEPETVTAPAAPVAEAKPAPQPVADREPVAQQPQPAAVPNSNVSIEELSANAQQFMDWPEILQIIKGNTKSVAMAFANSAAYVSGEYMLIDAPEIAFDLLKRPEQRQRMREAIRKVTGRVYKLGPYRRPRSEEEADPLEQLAMRARNSGIQIEEE